MGTCVLPQNGMVVVPQPLFTAVAHTCIVPQHKIVDDEVLIRR